VLFALLDDLSWRERIVEEHVYGAGQHVRATSSFQFGLSADALDLEPSDGPVRLWLPITRRDKELLVNFDLAGPDGAGQLLPRAAIADLQAAYLLRRLGGVPVFGPQTADLLNAICRFTPYRFLRLLAERRDDRDRALADYLASGLGPGETRREIAVEHVAELRRRLRPAAALLAGELDEPQAEAGAAEELLLALPLLQVAPADAAELSTLVDDYVRGVERLSHLGLHDLLGLLCAYGRRWEVIAELAVPVGERFSCSLSEDRPLILVHGVSHQRFALGDAQSAHLEARVTDPTIEMGKVDISDLAGRPVSAESLESVRLTREAIALYSSDDPRPAVVDVRIPLGLKPAAVWPAAAVVILAVASTVVAAFAQGGDQLAGVLGVLVLPVTLAAAVLVVRERTPLAERLQRRWPRDFLFPAMGALWLTALVRLVVQYDAWLW